MTTRTTERSKRDERVWLVGHDFSAHADKAADLALEDLSRLGGGRLALVHVFTVVLPSLTPGPRSIRFASLEYALRHEATQKLKVVAARLRARAALLHPELAVVIEDPIAVEGTAVEQILRMAEEIGAERIVLGTRGHTGLRRLFLGSVAERVVRLAPVPTVVSPPWRKARAKEESAFEGREVRLS